MGVESVFLAFLALISKFFKIQSIFGIGIDFKHSKIYFNLIKKIAFQGFISLQFYFFF